MKIKRYTVSNMQEAINVIKKDMGPNAIIIGSEKAPRKSIWDFLGPRQLIVTAAVEERQEETIPPKPEVKEIDITGNNKRLPAAAAVLRTQPPLNSSGGLDISRPRPGKEPIIPKNVLPARLPEPLLDFGEEEKDDWFKMLVHKMADQGEVGEMDSTTSKWRQILREMEIHDKIAEILLSDLKETPEVDSTDTEEFFKISLKNKIVTLVERAYKNSASNRIMTFVGPTGVGKTTTLVKIATRYQVFHHKSIALIALYDHRFGALEELNYYAEIIGAPVEIVMTPGELDKAVQKHQDKDYIFIDTEGRPSKNTGQILELKTFLDAIGDQQDVLLVLSATTKNRDIMRIARDFSRAGFSKMVFTKLDETDTLGSMLNVICEIGAPVSYITNGQNIPDDIEAVNPKRLANLILEGLDRGEALAL